jgi:hypothetical protein
VRREAYFFFFDFDAGFFFATFFLAAMERHPLPYMTRDPLDERGALYAPTFVGAGGFPPSGGLTFPVSLQMLQ